MKKMLKMAIFLGLGGLAMAAVSCSSEPAPTLTESAKDLAISSIMGYDEVSGAEIKQDGRDLSLVVIVGCATSEDVAKDLGDNFVRMVKSFGPESAPTGKDIGKGEFDYLVGVYCANENQIALGAKNRSSTHINW